VFLQVSPTNREPDAVFANTPIEIVATYFAVERSVQYIQNPGSTGWNKNGWSVWYASSRPDAFLSSLHAVHGNRAFLIYATQDFMWQATGAVTAPASPASSSDRSQWRTADRLQQRSFCPACAGSAGTRSAR